SSQAIFEALSKRLEKLVALQALVDKTSDDSEAPGVWAKTTPICTQGCISVSADSRIKMRSQV
ncbi:MAG: hypothetical protein R6W31_12765, partial [Bacteroidales bacterium]